MKNFEYFEVSDFPSLLKIYGLLFEELDEVEELHLGDVLNFVDFLEDSQNFLDGPSYLLSLDCLLH